MERAMTIDARTATLPGDVEVPPGARGIVVFAHGSGSSRSSPRNRAVAEALRSTGQFGTLLFDLLTPAEDTVYENRFDIGLLADRLVAATRSLSAGEAGGLPVGYFGASTGAAAAIQAATELPDVVRAVVSRGGRPDLVPDALERLAVPTLLIVGGDDREVIGMNERARARMPHATSDLVLVPGATHLFEEPGALEQVARLAYAWFDRYLGESR